MELGCFGNKAARRRGRRREGTQGTCRDTGRRVMFRIVVVCAALVAFAALATADAQVQPSPVAPSPVKRTILQKADLPGTNFELIYATVEIAAGFKAGRHFHPGTAMALVVEGEFWFQLDGQ